MTGSSGVPGPASPEPAPHGAPAQQQRRPSGQLEQEIFAVVQASPTPLGPAQVRAALGGELAYNTVHTVLTRLVDKQLLRRRRLAGRRVYEAAADGAALAAERMRSELLAAGDRRQVLRHFVGSLSPDEEQALRAMLAGMDPTRP